MTVASIPFAIFFIIMTPFFVYVAVDGPVAGIIGTSR